MKRKFFLAPFLLQFLALPALAQLRVSNSPTGAAVVLIQPSAVFVTWTVQSDSTTPFTAVSPEGLFVLGEQVLGRVDTSLTTTPATGGTAIATETLLIPPDVSNRAFKLNTATFFYRREFQSTADGSTGSSQLTCRLSTTAYGNFSVGAVTLFFENQRGQATFTQNERNVRAFAEVRYNGTGLLKAVWEVQEPSSSQFRVLQQVNYHLTYGDRIVFESPSNPPLPTILTGRHTLAFRIEQPISGFEIPTVTYFVKAREPEDQTTEPRLQLKVPSDSAVLRPDTAFEWTAAKDAAIVKFSIYEKGTLGSVLPVSPSVEPLPDSSALAGSRTLQSPPALLVKGVEVFSASLPADTVTFTPRPDQFQRLRPGQWYVWQVQTLDSSGKIQEESSLRAFQVSEQKE
jgi:hypothetical protein